MSSKNYKAYGYEHDLALLIISHKGECIHSRRGPFNRSLGYM